MSNHPITIITDSTADLSAETLEKHGIVTVPLYVIWGEESLKDGVDIDKPTFYSRLPKDPIHPKTSQPTPADFVEVLKKSGAKEAVVITIADGLSGTYDSVCTARGMVDIPVHVVDSRSTSVGLGFEVMAAVRARDAGSDAKAIVAAVEKVREKISLLFVVDTLDYLHKGGRIGGAAKLLGSALQLKPLLELNNQTGMIDAVERIRTRSKSLQRLVEATFERVDPDKPIRTAIMHGAAPDDAAAVCDEIRARCSPIELITSDISPILGVHTGPGVVGIGAYNE
jgi:DegV family protein with EDD domain